MVVYGILKHEENGQILHKGTLEACKGFVKPLEHKDSYDSLNICQDNGTIEKRAISNSKPTEWLIDLIEK